MRPGPPLRSGVLWVLIACLFPLSAAAAHSGLTIVPTADTLGESMWCLHLQVDGRLSGAHADTFFLNTEMTIGDRLEFGFDFDLSEGVAPDDHAFFNIKYVFAVSQDGRFKAAAGFWNGDPVKGMYPYVTATADLGVLRLHGGLTQTRAEGGRREDWFVGVDRAFAQKWVAMADYQCGEENFATAALSYQMTPRFGGLLGVQWPNAGGGVIYTFQVWVTGGYKAGSRTGS